MSVFDKAAEKLLHLSKNDANAWVKRINDSSKDIRFCKGQAAEDSVTRTCALCVALNRTIFKKNNKPEYFHPHCKCEWKQIELREVTLDFPIEKITQYLLVHPSKSKLMNSWGYTMEDAQEIYNTIAENAKNQYLNGEYTLGRLNENGQRIEIKCILNGKKDKSGQTYRFITGWMVYPNGMLHNNTPYAKANKKEEIV